MEGAEMNTGAVLPERHEEQLQLGFRMIERAFGAKIHALDHEIKGLRISCEEQKTQAAGLQRKNSALEVELVEGHQRSQQLSEENKELFKTVQQLRRQLTRLEGLKKKVLDSISDDQMAEYETEDSKLYMRDDYLRGAVPLTMQGAAASQGHPAPPMSMGPPTTDAGSPYTAPQPPWSASPPLHEPVATGHSAAAGLAGGSMVDGKEFFRKARSNLSYEAFNDFLASIKRLNNQQQSREETLEEARGIFGHEQQHLYKEFEQLLNRHAM
mmetsp:Transcript_53158/g.137353  ORF Transcript_53158/g.137353 Transcript_53158/m.137353 type:complete len:269 (+) Transcript_53158:117-923(+)